MELTPRLEEEIVKAARAMAPVFQANGWRWAFVGVPDEQEIARTLRRLVRELKAENSAGAGRVTVWRDEVGIHFGIEYGGVFGKEYVRR